MLKNFYRSIHKSMKKVSKEKVRKLKSDITVLEEQIKKREVQIDKFICLIKEDPENKERYQKRIDVHKEFIKNELLEIEKINFILLDS